MKTLSLEKEKISAKLLYLFEPSLVDYLENINEETSSKTLDFAVSFVKKIFSGILSIINKFFFIALLVLLLICISLEPDILTLIAKAFSSAFIGKTFSHGFSKGATVVTDLLTDAVETDKKAITKLLEDNGFNEVDLDADSEEFPFGICVQEKDKDGKKINKKMSVKEALDYLRLNGDDNVSPKAKLYYDMQLSLVGKIGDNFSKFNWFGLKFVVNYLEGKAKNIQNYVSDIILIIISIFKSSKKTVNEKFEKQMKKIMFFNEHFLKEKKKNFYYENYFLPHSKIPVVDFVGTYVVGDNRVNVNTLSNSIQSGNEKILTDIFKKPVGSSYKWDKNEYDMIKSYLEKNIKKPENIDFNKDDKEQEKVDIEKNNTDDMGAENVEKDTQQENVPTKKPSIFSLKAMETVIKSSIVKYMIIGLIIVVAIVSTFSTGGLSSLFSLKLDFIKSISQMLPLDTETIVKWLGWPLSLASVPTYMAIKKYVSSLTAEEVSQTIEKADNNEKAKETVSKNLEILKKSTKNASKEEKSGGFIDKTKKFFGFGKKPQNDSFTLKNKKELLYNENYIFDEYFNIEKKLNKKTNY